MTEVPSPAAGLTLTVVVPTRQTRELTLRCLSAIAAAADGVPPEVVIVDDGSTDGSAAAIRSTFPNTTLLRNEVSRGFTAAANRGVAAARGAVVLLLNSDTELAAGSLQALSAAFCRHPELGVAGARLLYPDGSPQWSHGPEPGLLWYFALASGLGGHLGRRAWWRRARLAVRSTARARDAYLPVGWVTGAALAFRHEVWRTVGPLHEGFRFYGQDLDFCLRTRDAGWEVGLVHDCVVVHHHGATIAGTDPAGYLHHQNPALLWPDLVLAARRRGGPRRARQTAQALATGARLRLATRRLSAALRPGSRTEDWRREHRALARGLAALCGRPSPDQGGRAVDSAATREHR